MSSLGNKQIMANNIKFYLNKSGKTQKEICKDLGIAETTFSGWVRAVTYPRIDKIEKMANYFGIEKSDLVEDKTKKDNDKSLSNGSRAHGIKIPILGRVVAGIPIEAVTDIEGYEEITADMASRGDFFALRIQGHSMEPRIEDGEIVICQCQSDVDSGDIAIVLVNGDEATCKQVRKGPEGITLIGFNPIVYAPHFYSNKEIEELPVRIIGRVVESRKTW